MLSACAPPRSGPGSKGAAGAPAVQGGNSQPDPAQDPGNPGTAGAPGGNGQPGQQNPATPQTTLDPAVGSFESGSLSGKCGAWGGRSL